MNRQTAKQGKNIDISVIIPMYNVEAYLATCIESVLKQNGIIEVILIDDGSTDKTVEAAKYYAKAYGNIIFNEQIHSGPSIARNRGLMLAQGEYIAFIDSDDWVSPFSLSILYKEAKKHKADMISGKMAYIYPDGKQVNIHDKIPLELRNNVMSGAACFTSLMHSNSYYPMACGYIYRREWIQENLFTFDEYIIHEDEIWTQLCLCKAKRVILTDFEFYYYRKREGSIMHSLDTKIRLHSLFHIASRFIAFASEYSSREYALLKNWIYVNTYRIYALAFTLLADLHDNSFSLPDHDLYLFCTFQNEMYPETRNRCAKHYTTAVAGIDKYYKWKTHSWNTCTDDNQPLISCLCVTHHKPEMLARVVRCFHKQSYENKQLVIVYEDLDISTSEFIRSRQWDKSVKIVRIDSSSGKIPLGELRNISIKESAGEFVCQWDDDDWFDPDRLSVQMQFIQKTGKPACMLSQWVVFDALNNKAYISNRRLWEGSILCRKDLMLNHPYPAIQKGEDSSVINTLYRNNYLHIIEDMPELYIYVSHGKNTWEQSHFNLILQSSTELPEEYVSEIQDILDDDEKCKQA